MINLLQAVLVSISSLVLPSRVSDSVIELPDSHQIPKMITMNFYGDSATQMGFNWNTDYRTDSILQISLKKDDFSSDNTLEFVGKTIKSKIANDGFIHQVVAKNLQKSTKYYYRLGDKELNAWSNVGSFETESENKYTSFAHLSDPQMMEKLNVESYGEVLHKVTNENDLDFMCITGDFVNQSWKDHNPELAQWDMVLTKQADILQNIPAMPVAGNHEEASNDFASRFNLPLSEENQDVSSGIYYSFDYHNIHFTCINTNDTNYKDNEESATGLSSLQLSWIEQDLKDNLNASWRIVLMHKGIYDAGGHSSNVEKEDYDIAKIREQLSPLFTKYKVDIVLQGHDHLYSRSYPISGVMEDNNLISKTSEEIIVDVSHDSKTYKGYENPHGPIYLNTGTASGSKYYNVVNYDKNIIPLEKAYGSDKRMFTTYYVEDNSLFGDIYELSNGEMKLYDSFAIVKNTKNDHIDNRGDKSSNNDTIIIILSVVVGLLLIGGVVIFFLIKKRGGKVNG